MKCLIAVTLMEVLPERENVLISIDSLVMIVKKEKLMEAIPFKDVQKIEPGHTFLVKGECYIKGVPVLCVAGRSLSILPEYTLEIAGWKSVDIEGEQYKIAKRDKVNYLELLCEVTNGSNS